MAKQSAATVETPEDESPRPPRAWLPKAKIAGIIAAIMGAEFVAILFVMPSSSQSASPPAHVEDVAEGEQGAHDAANAIEAADHGSASKEAKGHGKKDEHGATASPAKSGTASEEIDLGEFSVTSFQPASNTTLFISFHLFGTLLHKNSDELQARLDDNKHRIRDNIIVIIRSAEIADLTDAGLGLIKRRILETTNKTLGKPLLQAVVFSDFSFVEQ